jgi:DNA polymerase-3 subunit epsilon
MAGYAAIDLETTGLAAGGDNRIIEIGIVLLDDDGGVAREWTTLVNPHRDVGPVHIHGIHDDEVANAPDFEEVAGDLVALLQGRTLVAHNLMFEVQHLLSEFDRIGVQVPIQYKYGVCTLYWSGRLLPEASRALSDCCAVAGVSFDVEDEHAALTDARGCAALIPAFLAMSGGRPPWQVALDRSQAAVWPSLPENGVTPVLRSETARAAEPHFLDRLVERLPRATQPEFDSYFGMLDAALLDRKLTAEEVDGLVATAAEFGLDRAAARQAHVAYLDQIAVSAWEDGIITGAERSDLELVAHLLGMGSDDVAERLNLARPAM